MREYNAIIQSHSNRMPKVELTYTVKFHWPFSSINHWQEESGTAAAHKHSLRRPVQQLSTVLETSCPLCPQGFLFKSVLILPSIFQATMIFTSIRVAIVGAGCSGAALAIVLARNPHFDIHVFEALPEFDADHRSAVGMSWKTLEYLNEILGGREELRELLKAAGAVALSASCAWIVGLNFLLPSEWINVGTDCRLWFRDPVHMLVRNLSSFQGVLRRMGTAEQGSGQLSSASSSRGCPKTGSTGTSSLLELRRILTARQASHLVMGPRRLLTW